MIDPQATFSDEEARHILTRAAAQEEKAERASTSRGLSVRALQEIAREAGLNPLHVEAAAREALLRRESAPVSTWMGLPQELRVRRVVPGSVSDAQWERMVAEFRRTFRRSGMTSQFGGVREWISANDESNMPVQVRMEPLDEGTLITLWQPMTVVPQVVYSVGGTFAVAAGLIGLLSVVGTVPGGLAIFFLLLAVLGSAGFWGGYRAWLPRRAERFDAVLDRVELIARTE